MKEYVDSLNMRTTQLESENKRLKTAIELLLTEKRQWIESKSLQNQIIQQTVENINSKNAFMSEEIKRIHEENIKLREENEGLKERCRCQ